MQLYHSDRKRVTHKGTETPECLGSDNIINKVLKVVLTPLDGLLRAIFMATQTNYIFPRKWTEAVVIGMPKSSKS